MSLRFLSLPGLFAVALIAGCKDNSSPISHAPTHLSIVSGANQSGDLSKALDSALVVLVLDGTEKPVAGVVLTWTVTGGGALSATTTTTDTAGKATVTWTLAPTAGVQVVTVTSASIAGASASFVATNGATISGTVTGAGGLPFGAGFSRAASGAARFNTVPARGRQLSSDRIVVGFKNDVAGVAAAGSSTYRSLSVARQTTTRLQQSVAALSRSRPLSGAEISPAILAARMHVDDTLQIDAVMESLRSDPSVAWVRRDGFMTIRDGTPRPIVPDWITQLLSTRAPLTTTAGGTTASSVATKLPNDPNFWLQLWPAAMIDLPRAWAITTGSPNVTVAVVDMGIRFDNADIAPNLTADGYDFVTPFTFPAEHFCDGTTFTTTTGDGDGPDSDPTDPDDIEFNPDLNCWEHSTMGDHGLWTAGIVGAVGNEGAGLAGVNWNVRIRPIRVLDITGGGSFFDIAQGILYAAGLPARGANGALVQAPRSPIINMSLGGTGDDPSVRAAVAAAVAAGSLVVASAGNSSLDFDTFPAAYPGVIGVAAVGQDGNLSTYSNAGTFVAVSAPGGDFRLDDNGGGSVVGLGWNFVTNRPTAFFGYGTSASAPFVSGVAALLLAQTPTLTAAQLTQRIEQYATRPAGATRSDTFGWGIVNAYNSLTQQNGPARQTFVRLIDATSGLATRTAAVAANGNFALARVQQGTYYLQAGDDEGGDATIGIPGRRFAWAGGSGSPTVFNVNANSLTAAIAIGVPTEVEPNDDVAHANILGVGSYVVGNITPPDVRDVYSITISTPGVYTIETSGVVGTCGIGIELDTFLSVVTSTGTLVGSNDNFTSTTSRLCSHVQATLAAGVYYATVTGVGANAASRGRYRLAVRAGP
ncbi:MAG: hypothetical protein JWM41_4587 [Gemmatimonadetes bacterium]|nr:hypothetical protein [Gemmatimonadota bacterium]